MVEHELSGALDEQFLRSLFFFFLWLCFLNGALTVFCLDAVSILDDVVDPEFQICQVERLGEVLVGSNEECLLLVFLLCSGSQQDDGQMVELRVFLYPLRQFVAAHFWHHDIGYDQVERLLLDNVQCFLAILGNIDMIVRPEQLAHQHEQFYIILDDQ